ncbi:unnamed protein product [Durusdinium trenchii]|uniref:Uncharacterized protein n=1 Tax=Durusdinium trenchii TaxID=1381693 RepID=A0ABP0Q6P2_9DINO
MERMNGDDQSFAELMDLLWQSLCKTSQNGGGGQGQRKPSRSSASDLGEDASLISMLAKLTLRQEDQLNQIHFDKSFIFFVQAGKGSLLPLMLKTSKDWHGQRESGQVTASLRQHMFRSVFEELAYRASKLPFGSNDHELIKALQSKQVLTATNSWNYLQWDSKEKTLKPAARDPLPSEEAAALIQKIHSLAAQADPIHWFSALKPVPQDSTVTDSIVEGPGLRSLRCPTTIDRQRAYAADLCSNPTIDLAEVTIG